MYDFPNIEMTDAGLVIDISETPEGSLWEGKEIHIKRNGEIFSFSAKYLLYRILAVYEDSMNLPDDGHPKYAWNGCRDCMEMDEKLTNYAVFQDNLCAYLYKSKHHQEVGVDIEEFHNFLVESGFKTDLKDLTIRSKDRSDNFTDRLISFLKKEGFDVSEPD